MDQNTFTVFLLGGIGLLWVIFRQKKRAEMMRRASVPSISVRRMSDVSRTSESRKRDLDRMARLQGNPSNTQSGTFKNLTQHQSSDKRTHRE